MGLKVRDATLSVACGTHPTTIANKHSLEVTVAVWPHETIRQTAALLFRYAGFCKLLVFGRYSTVATTFFDKLRGREGGLDLDCYSNC